MNREQRRKLKKNSKKIADHIDQLADEIDNHIKEGERVRLNVDGITKRKDYSRTRQAYREFVEANRDRTFTAHLYRPREDGFSPMIELVEAPEWLFWHGDLIRVTEGV